MTDEVILKEFAYDQHLVKWIRMAHDQVQFQGLPARICWLGYGERERFGLIINDLVKSGKISAPIVIGRDHLDCGSVASPNRETEKMMDGSDAIADWPILNALLNTIGGATWVSVHHGGGVGIGYSIPPAWSSSPMEQTLRPNACHAFSRTTPAWASCVMPMQAIRKPSGSRKNTASACRHSGRGLAKWKELNYIELIRSRHSTRDYEQHALTDTDRAQIMDAVASSVPLDGHVLLDWKIADRSPMGCSGILYAECGCRIKSLPTTAARASRSSWHCSRTDGERVGTHR